MSVNLQKVLITGSSGFIGSNLIEFLKRNGISYTGIDIASADPKEAVDITEVDWHSFDLSDFDAVIHLAAKISVEESFRIPDQYYEVNVEATRRLFSACISQGVKKVIFASSAAVYGDSSEEIKTVGMEGKCESPYAENKLEVEEFSKSISHDATEIVCLRFFNVYGPGQKGDSPYSSVIPIFIRALFDGQLTIHGDGSQTRDFIHVQDVCRSILEIIKSENIANRIINVGTGKRISILDLANLVINHGNETRRELNASIQFSEKRKGDVSHSTAENSELLNIIGDISFIEIEDGINQLVREIIPKGEKF